MDSDLTVLAYVGTGTPNLATPAKTYQSLVDTYNWQFITHLPDVSQNGGVASFSTSTYSKYWLIGTYIPLTVFPARMPGARVGN